MNKTADQIQTVREARNKRRRDRYAKDPNYRATVKSSNRSQYGKRAGVVPRVSCAESIPQLANFGRVRAIMRGRQKVDCVTFTVQEIAKAMGYHPWVVYRWQGREQFPKPAVLLHGHNKGIPGSYVFTHPQATRLLSVLADHQAVKMHFQQTDLDTIARLRAAMKGEA